MNFKRGPYLSSETELKFRLCLFTFSIKRERNEAFARLRRANTGKKCTKKCDARAKLLFWLLNLLFLWRSHCRPRRWILKSLIADRQSSLKAGVRQMQTADLQTGRPTGWQCCEILSKGIVLSSFHNNAFLPCVCKSAVCICRKGWRPPVLIRSTTDSIPSWPLWKGSDACGRWISWHKIWILTISSKKNQACAITVSFKCPLATAHCSASSSCTNWKI